METDRARELLASERSRVERELSNLRNDRDDTESGIDQLSADAGSDLLENEVDQSMIERLAGELEAIERAEKRIEEGTYGVSVDSGKPIPDGRLEAIPWAERTADEQSSYEAQHRS